MNRLLAVLAMTLFYWGPMASAQEFKEGNLIINVAPGTNLYYTRVGGMEYRGRYVSGKMEGRPFLGTGDAVGKASDDAYKFDVERTYQYNKLIDQDGLSGCGVVISTTAGPPCHYVPPVYPRWSYVPHRYRYAVPTYFGTYYYPTPNPYSYPYLP